MLYKIFAVILLSFIAINSFSQVIKLGTVAPDGSPWHHALKEMAQEWKEISNGKIRLRIYPGGTAGDEPDLVRKMRIGQLHAAALTTSGLAYISSDFTALTFPTMINTYGELDYVINKVGPEFEKMISKKGFFILSWSNAGWVHFFSKTPVVTPNDMKTQKLFFWGSESTYVELLKKSGFHPVPLSITDLLPGLQTGLVTAFASPPQAALAYQWYKKAPNMCSLRWQPLPGTFMISNRTWEKIPAELRPKLKKSAMNLCAKLQKQVKGIEEEAIEVMKKHGLKVNEVPIDIYLKWRKLVKEKAYPVFVGKRFSAKIYNNIQKALKQYRLLQKKTHGKKPGKK